MATISVCGSLTVSLRAVLTQGGAKEVVKISSAEEVKAATHVVVTDVEGVVEAVRERVRGGVATLIMGQAVGGVFEEQTSETPGFLSEAWVAYEADSRCKFIKSGTAYFPGTERCLKAVPLGWVGGWTTPFSTDSVVAGMEHGHVLVLQFQPEVSSIQGRATIMRWLKHTPTPPQPKIVAKQRTSVAALLRVSSLSVKIGTTDPIQVQNLGQTDLPAAWEAGGADMMVILGDNHEGIRAAAEICMEKTAVPVVAQADTNEAAVELLSLGVSQVVITEAEVMKNLPRSKVLSLTSVCGDVPAAETCNGVVFDLPSDVDPGNVTAVVKIVAQSGRASWVLGENTSLSTMLQIVAEANPTHFIRYPLTNGAAPAKIKGALLTADINTRVQPTGMQYNSTNLQCVVPSLEIQQGCVPTGKGATSITDLAAAVDSFSVVGDVCVVDVDTSLGVSDGKATREILKPLFRKYNVRYGGGVRTVETAMSILNEGATKVVIGSAGDREFLSQLPRERVVLSIDAVFSPDALAADVGSWTTTSDQPITKVITDLCDVVGHFQVTFLDPQLPGLDLSLVMKLAATCKASKVSLTIAGTVKTPQEIAALDEMGVECLISASTLGTSQLPLSTAITSIVKTDRQDGLIPTVVVDNSNGRALGMCYSNLESIHEAIKRKRGTYWSRSRGLWVKGETSGDVQELVSIALDCDRDCLLFTVKQAGAGFCHRHQQTCFGPATGFDKLVATLQQRKANAPVGSYTKRLFDDQALLRAKLMEEATELADSPNVENCAFEAADLIFFAFVRCVVMGVDMSEIQKNLDFKGRKVHRRPGHAKPQFVQQPVQN